MKMPWFFVSLIFLATAVSGTPARAAQEASPEDVQTVMRLREGLHRTVEYVARNPSTFREGVAGSLPDRDKKAELRAMWQQYLDYSLGLQVMERAYSGFTEGEGEGEGRDQAFQLSYAAFLAQYRSALDLLKLMDANPFADVLLNEKLPELGLPANTYADFKFRFLNVAVATQYAALAVVYKLRDAPAGDWAALRPGIEEDRAAIAETGKGKGELITLKNAWQIVKDGASAAWLPAQTVVCKAMGRTKVARLGENLVKPEQIAASARRMEPGDFMLQRREWYASNLGLPGFWTHAALYMGTAKERAAFFDDADVRRLARENGREDGSFEGLLKDRFPEAYALAQSEDEQGHTRTVVEAIEKGVVFTSMEHSAACDSLAVFRPRLSKAEKAQAILRAFAYSGRPYDYSFDFLSDAALVCSELVFKAYEPSNGYRGVNFPKETLAGKLMVSPNGIARQFAEYYGKPELQNDLVLFLDGFENANTAVEQDATAFLSTWERPKWHILVQGEPAQP
jgi:hypothetical protein